MEFLFGHEKTIESESNDKLKFIFARISKIKVQMDDPFTWTARNYSFQ